MNLCILGATAWGGMAARISYEDFVAYFSTVAEASEIDLIFNQGRCQGRSPGAGIAGLHSCRCCRTRRDYALWCVPLQTPKSVTRQRFLGEQELNTPPRPGNCHAQSVKTCQVPRKYPGPLYHPLLNNTPVVFLLKCPETVRVPPRGTDRVPRARQPVTIESCKGPGTGQPCQVTVSRGRGPLCSRPY